MKPAPARFAWLDATRIYAAIMIVGIHWLHATFSAGLFAGINSEPIFMGFDMRVKGFGDLHNFIIAGTAPNAHTWLTNLVGLVGEFGFPAVSTFIILSGFSISFAGRDPDSPSGWLQWFRKRAVRLLVPFYIAAIPCLLAYLALTYATNGIHTHFMAAIHAKLAHQIATPLLGVVLSHTVLFDPFNPQWMASFFTPAWWFVPAILVAYVLYPLVARYARGKNWGVLLGASAIVSLVSYKLYDISVFRNEDWYYIILQESFNFTLGVVVGASWSRGGREKIEGFLFGTTAPALGVALFCVGNIVNLFPPIRPAATLLMGPGLTLIIVAIAHRTYATRVTRFLIAKIDAYDLYLVHQPFAFPLALALRSHLHDYTIFVGFLIYVPLVGVASIVLSRVTKFVFARAPWLTTTTQPRPRPAEMVAH